MNIERILEELHTAQQSGAQAKEQTAQSLRELRKRVENGVSTGNVLRDFVILHYSADAEIEQKLQGLYTDLEKNAGDIVMVRESTIKVMRTDGGCFGGGDAMNENVTLSFGKINNSPLLSKEKFFIPVASTLIVNGSGYDSQSINIQNVTVDEKTSLLLDTTRYLFGRERTSSEFGLPDDGFPQTITGGVEVLVGDEAVRSYVIKKCHLLNQRVQKELFPSEEYDFHDREKLYARIRELVFDSEKRQSHLSNKAQQMEEKRKTRIDSLVGELIEYQTSSNKKPDVEYVKKRLREGIELGAHTEHRILTYTPGVKVYVGEFFRFLCQGYDVKCPEKK